ncbi:MAG: cytosolic protein [Chloroflexota bacterium]
MTKQRQSNQDAHQADAKTQVDEQHLRADYDSPWKEIIEDFENFILFYLPEIHREIDWSRAPEFLDKELQQLVGDVKTGRRYADKLVKVWLRDGSEMHVLIHVEVQGAREASFEERMYIYHYRIFDQYKIHVVSIAILTDDDPSWKPKEYKKERWGCKVHFEFITKKLLDYKEKWAELEKNPNPFAVVTMANLKTMETRQDHEERLRWKVWMVRELYKRGIKQARIIRLLRFVNWMMALPESLQEKFKIEWSTIEEEHNMMYMMDIEKEGYDRGITVGHRLGHDEGIEKGIEKGRKSQREMILQLLHHRFQIEEYLSLMIEIRLQQVNDEDTFKQLINHAMDIDAVEQFLEFLPAENHK